MNTLPCSLSDFAGLAGEPFALAGEGLETGLQVELVEAKALPQPAFQGREPFTLLFQGPASPILPQRTYRVAHRCLPALDVFLVPIGADAAGVRYQAVFS